MELKTLDKGKNVIEKVEKNSIAEELNIVPGDILVAINDCEVKDIIDYKYLISDNYVVVRIEKENGDIWEFEIEKEFDEDLGIFFTNPLIDKAKSCRNNCMFCFIDQLPKGMRKTLYFKDDDSRLSFLQGNFITLTNLNDEDIERIVKYRLSPINISVHTTNPELRIKMLNNKDAGKLFSILNKFSKANIEMNCQIVLVPGVNDGSELDRTLEDLSNLYPSINSVAVVPVGITKYREGLPLIEPFDSHKSLELIEQLRGKQNQFISKLGTRFVFPSDEFYVMADEEVPSYDEYEGFPQIENGVGLMRLFFYEIDQELKKLKDDLYHNKKYILATGTLASKYMESICKKVMDKIKGLSLIVVPIKNNFFGHNITVSGLVTGTDLVDQLKDYENIDGVIIPESMLRSGEEVLLDDYTISNIEEKLDTKVIVAKVVGSNFVDIFKKDVM